LGDVEAETEQIRQVAHQVYGRAMDLRDSPMLQSSWEIPVSQQQWSYTGQVSNTGQAARSGLPAAQQFWNGVHATLFGTLRSFQSASTESLAAIGVAYAAAANAYDTTDALNAEDVQRRVFVEKPAGMQEEAWRETTEYKESIEYLSTQPER
jgi:hypothetical protein